MLKITNFLTHYPQQEICTSDLYRALHKDSIKNLSYQTIRMFQISPLLQGFFAETSYPIVPNTEAFLVGHSLDTELIFDDSGVFWCGVLLVFPSGYTPAKAFRENPHSIDLCVNSFGQNTQEIFEPVLKNGNKTNKVFTDAFEFKTQAKSFLNRVKALENPDERELLGKLWLAYVVDATTKHLGRFVESKTLRKSVHEVFYKMVGSTGAHYIEPEHVTHLINTIFFEQREQVLKCYTYLYEKI